MVVVVIASRGSTRAHGVQGGSTEQLAYHIYGRLAVKVDGALRPIPLGVGLTLSPHATIPLGVGKVVPPVAGGWTTSKL